MKQVSINELSVLTGKTRETIGKALANLPFNAGPKGAKLFNSYHALSALYRSSSLSGEKPTDQLALKRIEQIDLEMEVTRQERITIEAMNAVNDEVFQSAAALIKSHKGKVLTEEVINDIYAAFRSIPEKLKWTA
jgi:transcriptional antiterminator